MDFKKISLLLSILGILIIILISEFSELSPTQIKKIKSLPENKLVKAIGNITSIKNQTNFQILTIQDSTGKIQATLDEITNLKINQTIEITGKTQKYKNQTQIKAEKIYLIK